MKVLISKKSGRIYYPDETKDYHCKEGILLKNDLNSNKNSIFSNTNKEFILLESNNFDFRQKIKRGPQIITTKDLGYIIARTAINKDSIIVEAGGGSGSATSFFSKLVKKVYSFEIVEEHYKIIKKNLEYLNCENVELFNIDIKEKLKEIEKFDLLFLDLPNPHEIIKENINNLKKGNYIVCYLPSISQIQTLSDSILNRDDLYLEEITEIIIRNWTVYKQISRPNHQKEIDHTAFLVFIRKN